MLVKRFKPLHSLLLELFVLDSVKLSYDSYQLYHMLFLLVHVMLKNFLRLPGKLVDVLLVLAYRVKLADQVVAQQF